MYNSFSVEQSLAAQTTTVVMARDLLLTPDSGDNRASFSELGTVASIFQGIDVHMENSAVIRYACEALERLAINESNRLQVIEAGGIDLMLRVLVQHLFSAGVQQGAFRVLARLSQTGWIKSVAQSTHEHSQRQPGSKRWQAEPCH